jgi:polyphosphate kinase
MSTAPLERKRSSSATDKGAGKTARLDAPELYLNPHLSLLAFQRRVLQEAQDHANPLLERVKFISILGSNIDEFFMVRVAGLWQQIETRTTEISIDGRSPLEQLDLIRTELTAMSSEIYRLWREELVPELKKAGILILSLEELNPQQRTTLDDYFRREVYPMLTPLAVDQGRPFPHISNLSLNIGTVVTNGDGQERFARIKIPGTLPHLVPVPQETAGELAFVWIEHAFIANLRVLFPEMQILKANVFHVTRDAELAIQELEAEDLLESIQEAVWRRRFRDAVRLQIDPDMPQKLIDILTTNLELDQNDVYRVDGPVDISRVRALLNIDRPALNDKPFIPTFPKGFTGPRSEIFTTIREGDVLMHHPFESFQPVVDFLRAAAHDPDVLAIKMTLYRVGRNSPIVEALLEAIENGKQVAVLVELKARFDEESNIEWAQKLEREGVHVVYGLPGVKVHCKMALVVRREGDSIVRYLHLGTGNYNPSTARLYTDLGLFTCNEEIGADVSDLFNHLTGYSAKKSYRKLLVAPHSIRSGFERLIRLEIERHQAHGDGHLIFKMNALEDAGMIRLLYEASRAGVEIDLIVRGVCSLRPGLPHVSETIRVRSIIGRFLEHSRIFYFHNGGDERVYVGSADLMPRNLNRRVEVLFPVENQKIVRRIRDTILNKYLHDEAAARIMQSDGSYRRVETATGRKALDAQDWFLKNGA